MPSAMSTIAKAAGLVGSRPLSSVIRSRPGPYVKWPAGAGPYTQNKGMTFMRVTPRQLCLRTLPLAARDPNELKLPPAAREKGIRSSP